MCTCTVVEFYVELNLIAVCITRRQAGSQHNKTLKGSNHSYHNVDVIWICKMPLLLISCEMTTKWMTLYKFVLHGIRQAGGWPQRQLISYEFVNCHWCHLKGGLNNLLKTPRHHTQTTKLVTSYFPLHWCNFVFGLSSLTWWSEVQTQQNRNSTSGRRP